MKDYKDKGLNNNNKKKKKKKKKKRKKKKLVAERVKTEVVSCALRKEMHEDPSDSDWLICEFCVTKTARVTAVVGCLGPIGATTVFIFATNN
jgi:hypothetical protein